MSAKKHLGDFDAQKLRHTIHREASTGGVPTLFFRSDIQAAPIGRAIPKGFQGPHHKLTKGQRRQR